MDFDVRRNGSVLLSPNDGRYGELEVSYLSTSNSAPFDTRHQFIVIRQLSQATLGPLTLRIPWGDDGIKKAIRLAVVNATTSPTSFRSQSGTEILFRTR